MGYLNLRIGTDKHLKLDKNCLLISDGERDVFRYALEDINSILFENTHTMVSVPLLARLAEEGVACYVCGERHMPVGIVLPYQTHYFRTNVLGLQRNMPQPLRKRLWQAIVRKKIENQALCAEYNGFDATGLRAKIPAVTSGDGTNVEAQSAKLYFVTLYGQNFSRNDDSFINAALNYGYTILRGAIARTLALHGYEGSIGLHHDSQLNPWNLADDLIEPFRPVIDLAVCRMGEESLTPQCKKTC